MEEALDVVSRTFGSVTTANMNEDNSWTVLVTMTEKRTLRGQDEEVKEIVAQCTDDNFQKAYTISMNSVIEQFNDVLLETKTSSMFPGKYP